MAGLIKLLQSDAMAITHKSAERHVEKNVSFVAREKINILIRASRGSGHLGISGSEIASSIYYVVGLYASMGKLRNRAVLHLF